MVYLEKCIENIRHGREVVLTMELMQSLLTCFPRSSKAGGGWKGLKRNLRNQTLTVEVLIVELQAEHDLLALLVAPLLSDRVPPAVAARTRLELLDLLLTNSELVLTTEQARFLWRHCVVEASGKECQRVGEEWFTRAILTQYGEAPGGTLFEEGTCEVASPSSQSSLDSRNRL